MPPCLSFVRFVPCCHCLCIRSFFPCHWNAGLLRLVGLKEYGLGTQSLRLNCPLSEVGTPPPHNSGMAYGLETENYYYYYYYCCYLKKVLQEAGNWRSVNARKLLQQLVWPITTAFKKYITGNQLKICRLNIDDINRFKIIFGKPTPLLKSKMTRVIIPTDINITRVPLIFPIA